MTPISRPVTRMSLYPHRGRLLVATLGPGDVLYIRQKGRRAANAEGIDLASCYDLAVKRRVVYERLKKAKERKERRG
jgi:hypothetical protein